MIARLSTAIVAASGVTFALFMLMQGLVAMKDEVKLDEEKRFRFVDVIQDIQEQPPQRLERKVEKPPEPEAPPPEINTPVASLDGPSKLNLAPAKLNAGGRGAMGDINLGAGADGDFLPLVVVQPQYPRRAQERGVEGYCTVSLTVLEDGTVDPNSIALVEEDPKGYFFRASKKAASKFKYKPRVVNGKPQKVHNVKYKFSFNLAD